MRARISGAVALLTAGLLALSPLVGTAAFADDAAVPAAPPSSASTPAPTPDPVTTPPAIATPAPTATPSAAPSPAPSPKPSHAAIPNPGAIAGAKTKAVTRLRTADAGVPDHIAALQMTATQTSLNAAWTTPNDNGSPILRYVATLSYANGAAITSVTLDATATNVLFSDLTPVTSYYITVSTVNALGSADASQQWWTSGYPPHAPEDVQPTPDTNSIAVTWTAADYDGGAPVWGYDVRAINIATGDPTVVSVDASTFAATLTGLAPNTAYSVSVGNSNGYAETYSDGITVSTLVGTPGTVEDLQVAPHASHATVTWSPPTDDGGAPVTEYEVILSTGVPGDSQVVVDEGLAGIPSLPFTDLTPNTNYGVSVAASNGTREGAATTVWFTTPAASAPDQVGDLTAVPTDTTIATSWTAPTEDNGSPIIDYVVHVFTDADQVGTSTTVDADTTSFTTVGLSPNTAYHVVVTAENAAGGTDSAQDATTLQGPPADPTNVVGAIVDNGDGTATITATWDAVDGATSYAVELFGSDGTDTLMPTTNTSQTYSALADPTVTYTVAVMAFNDGAQSLPITSASFSLPTVSAPSVPRNVTLADEGNGTLTGTWDAPADNGGAAPSYQAIVTDSSGNHYYLADDFTSSRNVSFTVPTFLGDTYTMSVQATNAGGDSAAVVSNSVTTVGATVPAKPSIDTAVAVRYHDAGVDVTWQDGADGGTPITGYTVQLFDIGGTLLFSDTVDSDQHSYDFDGLSNNTAYVARLIATNVVGSSASSDALDVTTNPLDPMAPLLQTVENDGTSGFAVTVTGNTATVHVNNVPVGNRIAGVFRPWVYGIVYSSPTALGWLQVDSDGDATWTLPSLAPGIHHFAVLNDAGDIIGTTSFRIAGATSGTGNTDQTTALAFTGTDPGSLLALAVFALVSGVALVAVRRRRRALAQR